MYCMYLLYFQAVLCGTQIYDFQNCENVRVDAYIKLLLQTFQGLCYLISVLRFMLFLNLQTHQSHGKQRWLQTNRRTHSQNQ